MKGRQGGIPPTQWLISYSGFERLYYDTVASYKYWEGDLGKLQTLVFFNFLRQEMEDNFLLLLPQSERDPIRQRWAQGFAGAIGRFLVPFPGSTLPGGIEGDQSHPLLDVVDRLQAHMGPAVSGAVDALNPWVKPKISLDDPVDSYVDWVKAVSLLTETTAYKFPRFLPSVVLLQLHHGDEFPRVYSLIANRVYKTQFDLLFQNGEALPDECTMSVYPTIVGGFPNLFMELDLAQAPAFLKELRSVQTLDDWTALRNRYGILRNSERFWPALDWFNDWNLKVAADGRSAAPAPPALALPADGTFYPGTFVASSVGAPGSAITPVKAPAGLEYSGPGEDKHSVRGLVWANNALYVADEPAGRVKVYDKNGKFLGQSNSVELPDHLVVWKGSLYLSAGDAVLTAQLPNFPGDFTLSQIEGVEVKKACGMAFTKSGRFYIASRSENKILKFDSDFKPMKFECKLADNPEFLLHV